MDIRPCVGGELVDSDPEKSKRRQPLESVRSEDSESGSECSDDEMMGELVPIDEVTGNTRVENEIGVGMSNEENLGAEGIAQPHPYEDEGTDPEEDTGSESASISVCIPRRSTRQNAGQHSNLYHQPRSVLESGPVCPTQDSN